MIHLAIDNPPAVSVEQPMSVVPSHELQAALLEAAVLLECAADTLAGFNMPMNAQSCMQTATRLRAFAGQR